MKYVESVNAISYHRNGICGDGFYLVDFMFPGGDGESRLRLNAVYLMPHDEEGAMAKNADYTKCFVTDPTDATNRYRGDNFATEIHQVCVAYMNSLYAEAVTDTEAVK